MCNDCGIANCPQDDSGDPMMPDDVDFYACIFEFLTGQPITICYRCNDWVKVTSYGHNSGFAGEGVWWAKFSCGHDEGETGRYCDA